MKPIEPCYERLVMENITLRQRTLEHVKIFWEKTQDHELIKACPLERNTLEHTIQLFEESCKSDARSFGQVIYAGERYIGDIWCYGIDESGEKAAFISIVIFDRTCWGKGVGRFAIKQFSNLVFHQYAIDKLCAFTYTANDRSIRALEGSGFQLMEEFVEAGRHSCYFELYRDILGGRNGKNI